MTYHLLNLLSFLPLGLLRVVGWLGAIGYFFFAWKEQYKIHRRMYHCFRHKSWFWRLGLRWRYAFRLLEFVMGVAKMGHAPRNLLSRRVQLSGTDGLKLSAGQRGVLLGGHQFHWELLNWALFPLPATEALLVYYPHPDRGLNRWLKEIRSRYGGTPVPVGGFTPAFVAPQQDKAIVAGLLADQHPYNPAKHRWETIDFLNRPTRFVTGYWELITAKQAKVFYLSLRRTGWLRYAAELVPEPEALKHLPFEARTAAYAHHLEASILQQPENWLWTHNRWPAEA